MKIFSHFIIVTQKVGIIKWHWIFKFLNFLLNKMEARSHAVITLCSKKFRNLKIFSHFIIATFEVTIIKWQIFFKFLNFLLNKLKPAFFGNFEAIYLSLIKNTYFFSQRSERSERSGELQIWKIWVTTI